MNGKKARRLRSEAAMHGGKSDADYQTRTLTYYLGGKRTYYTNPRKLKTDSIRFYYQYLKGTNNTNRRAEHEH